VEIGRKTLRFHEHGVPAFRAAGHVRLLNRPFVEPGRDGFARQRDDVVVPPGEVLLQVWTVCRPYAVEPDGTVVAPVAGNRRITAREREVARVAVDRAAEARTGRQVETAVPLSRQRQPQLELVLRRDVPDHL